MDINVTRKYRGKKDAKGNVISDYSYRTGSTNTTVNVLKNAPIGDTYNDPLRTTLTDFVLCVNFKSLTALEYICPDDMLISEQTYEVGVADLLVGSSTYVLEDFLPQFEKLTIIPSELGVVLLIGKMKSSFVKTFTAYIEVKDENKIEPPLVAEYQDFVVGTAKDYVLLLSAIYPFSIDSFWAEVDDGTIDVSMKIGSTAITGIDGVTADTTASQIDATALNSVAIGDRVIFSLSATYTGTPTLIRIQIKTTRL